jgi:hypothetical protein
MRPPRWETLLRLAPLAAAALWCAAASRWLEGTPLCGFHWLTGHPCPLCGLTRALTALAGGHPMEALALHPLSLLAAALLVAAPLLSLAPAVERRTWQLATAAFAAGGALRWL